VELRSADRRGGGAAANHLGQSLQLVTVAEGVEDSAQFLTLRRMGCDVGQGLYFGRPMESEEISRLLGDDIAPPARKPATTG
jgi:EAL domain-containing protein (putative c-di-GMP-specific phosphodiesterase class I)